MAPDWMDKSSKEFRECVTCLQDSNSALGQKLETLNNAVNALQRAATKGERGEREKGGVGKREKGGERKREKGGGRKREDGGGEGRDGKFSLG